MNPQWTPVAARGAPSTEAWQMLAGLLEASRLIPPTLRAPHESVPLTLLSGFLGAGKTTLLNRLLVQPHGRRLAVLVNDFGRVNIDAALIRSQTEDMISLTNGCACCTVAGDLTRTLIELVQRAEPPDAVVLEASGLADPRGIAQVALSNPALRLDGVLTLVEAASAADGTLWGSASEDVRRTVALQIDAADLIVLTKTDEASAEQLQTARSWIGARGPGKPVLSAVHGDLPAHVVLGVRSLRDIRAEAPASWDHSEGFQSWCLQSARPLARPALQSFLDQLPRGLLRAKGVLWLADEPGVRHVYQRVGQRGSLKRDEAWGGEPPTSSLVLIGPSGCADGTALQQVFDTLGLDHPRITKEERP